MKTDKLELLFLELLDEYREASSISIANTSTSTKERKQYEQALKVEIKSWENKLKKALAEE